MSRIGVLTGLAAEERILRRHLAGARPPVRISCSAADPRRARREAAELLSRGAEGLVSFGLAGGLLPGLRSGDLLLADAVVLPDGRRLAAEAEWRGRLLSLAEGGGLAPRVGPVAGSDALLAGGEEKRALARRTGAVAVDMESHALAEAAAGAGVPFLVVRAVADTAEQALPRAARGAVDARGRPRAGRVLAGLLAAPWEGPGLVRLAWGAWKGLAALEGFCRLAGPAGFGVG